MPKSAKREEKTRKLILDTLHQHKDGLTISDIARLLELHYTTASKYLAILEAEQKLVRRDVGMAKVFRVKE